MLLETRRDAQTTRITRVQSPAQGIPFPTHMPSGGPGKEGRILQGTERELGEESE